MGYLRMGWDRGYYYRKRRVGQRVISEYVGPGLLGELGEAEDLEERLERQAEQESQRQERARSHARDRRMVEVHTALNKVIRGVLNAHEYRRHQRSEWRKPRAAERA